ncbi:DGQHR domain-containing protein [Paenibacillus macerans]|uniref:DGQHR domain-containing protein n=1 Tax=Paenibacillus macerans TaxID=44252 RepID=UPI00203A6FE2|nr:DGQHR domain-containing protein [Paenibacillus macerans]MCM3701918.1 DGQHR domain-containing protein [Paenibacillus macerans]
MNFMDKLVSDRELNGVKKKRSQNYIYDKFEPELQTRREHEGWEVDKFLKNSIRMKKTKPIDEQFEDDVWCMFASLGFQYMNKDRHFSIPYGPTGTGTTKQVDVFAVDGETIIFVECKCSPNGRKGDFKKEIESISGMRNGLFNEAKKYFPNRKTKYILATKNYEVSENDRARMKELGIQHFDEYAISYFTELTKHLGECARFQLLGNLFQGQKISAMENRIPAIEGKMGGHTYYSFSIEPEKLLKVAYVLHRNDANSDMMPTYQRIVKKNRLKEIQKFVDNGGFFPNSLIISIDSKKLKFDLAPLQVDSSISRIGILHLPQQYRSAYIIDGQHRLYGYADSKYAGSNSIPVVAFVNLPKEKQVELFMEINENQKSVSKNLQNTLNADLLWLSDDWNKRRRALRLNIAQRLGELQSSPLVERVTVGENESSSTRCITMDTIEKALKSTNFFSRYGKDNVIVEDGTFDKGSNEATLKIFMPFIIQCFAFFKSNLPEEWEKGEDVKGILVSNNSIHALINIFNDVVNHLIHVKKINPKIDNLDDLVSNMEYYLAPLVNYFDAITEEERKEIRTKYGSGGKPRVWRTFQKIISESREDFQPEGLTQWIRDNTKQFNVASFEMIHDIEHFLKNDFEAKLKSKYRDKWLTSGLPPKVYKQANITMGNQIYENKSVSLWDCVTLNNLKDIVTFGQHWSELFEKSYTRPNELKLAGGKMAKTEWITKLANIASNNSSNYSVSEEQYLFLKSIYEWLIESIVTTKAP